VRSRPRLERLEDRTVPSTLFVTNTRDDGTSGSLRAQVTAAQSGDTIRFDPGLQGATMRSFADRWRNGRWWGSWSFPRLAS
jgi:hypothetical protein